MIQAAQISKQVKIRSGRYSRQILDENRSLQLRACSYGFAIGSVFI